MKRFSAFILLVLVLILAASCEPKKASGDGEARLIFPVASEPPERNGFPH